MAYFFRRPSGIYYARIRVPGDLSAFFDAPFLRRSLHTTDHALASRLALVAALEWKTEFHRLRTMLDPRKLVTGSPLLSTPGLITLADAAQEVGLSAQQLFNEFAQRGFVLRVRIAGALGADVPLSELVFDDPSSPVLDVGETLADRSLVPVFAELSLRSDFQCIADSGVVMDCLFFRDAQRRRAVVFNLPGLRVDIGDLLAVRTDVEVIRAALAMHVTPAMLEVAASVGDGSGSPATADLVSAAVERAMMGAAYRHKDKPVSAMLADYFEERSPQLSKATIDQNRRMFSTFVEVMGDPVLIEIDRDLMKTYRARLLKVPTNLHRLRKRHPGKDIDELMSLAASERLELITPSRADRYIAKIGEAFAWAARHRYMKENPADNLATTVKPTVRQQDKRNVFDAETLGLIFGQQWYREGRGKKTKRGRYHHFQPFNYWMPVLALYTGARLNELAQLYLKDVARSVGGNWYLDFNLDGEGKVDSNDADEFEDDKQLKTVNAQRVVALHPELVRLGLPSYVLALREAGHVRLFPELKRDDIKGYGKYAGQWFNERFMGKKQKIERDGKKCFHSFRHTFMTTCQRAGIENRERNEMVGHARGEGQGHEGYIKDQTADEQAPLMARLEFELPDIAPFDVVEGIKALRDALSRKHDRRKGAPASE
jgi:integrase